MNKKTIKKILLAGALILVVAAAVTKLRGEEIPAVITVETSAPVVTEVKAGIEASALFATDYYWRHESQWEGYNAQTSVSVSHLGIDANIWAATALEEGDGLEAGETGEVDLTISKTFPTQYGDLTVGLIEYMFPTGNAENEREVFLGISPAFPFNPYLALYADMTDKGKLYGEAGVSHTVSLKLADLTVGGDIGVQNAHYGNGSDEVQGFGAYVSLSKEIKGFLAAIQARYDEDSAGEGDYWFGISLTHNF